MAGKFNFPRSLAIYLLLCLVAAQVTGNTSFCLDNRNLHTFVVSLDCNRIRIDTFQTKTKSNGKDKDRASMSLAHTTVLFSRLVNVTLAANLPYILVYKLNFLDVKMGSKNRPRLIIGRT